MAVYDQVRNTLEKNRFSFKGIVALILFGAIIMVFVFFDFPSQQLGGGGMAAQVNNSIISLADLQEESQRLEQFYAQFMQGADMGAQRQMIRSRALENLITSELLSQEAEVEGILTSDAEVRDFILNDIEPFKENGVFQKTRYFGYLASVKLSAEEFENKIRKDRKMQKVRHLFELAASPLKPELKLQEALDAKKLNLKFARLNREMLVVKANPAPNEIATWLQNADNEKKAKADYDLNKALYVQNETVTAQHILLKTAPGVDDAPVLKRVNDLMKDIKTADFTELAKKVSEDEGSKSTGGDLGAFGRGQMVPEFENAAFGAKIGEIVGPVKSQFGYHIIKVNDKKERKELSYDEAKTQVAGKMIAQTKVDGEIKKVEEAMKAGQVAVVESAVKTLGATFDETGLFSLADDSIPKLGAGDSIFAAMGQLKQAGQWANSVVYDAGQIYVLQLKEVKPADKKGLGEDPVKRLAREKSMGLMEAWIEANKKVSKIERNEAVLVQ